MSNIPPTSSTGTPKPSSGTGQVVPIQSLPDGLKNVARAMRVEGEVVQQNPDGSTRVKTPEGNIDITIRGRQPQPGTKLEIDIPTGNPPRQVTIRPAPAQAPQPQQPSTPPPTQTTPQPNIPLPQTPVTRPSPSTPPPQGQTGTQQPAPPTSGATPQPSTQAPLPQSPATGAPQTDVPVTKPLPASYQPPAPGTVQPQTGQLPPLATGQIVRLTPVPPAQAQTMIQQSASMPAETIAAAQITRSSFQADLIARGALDGLQKSLIQTMKTMTAQATSTQTTPIPSVQIKAPSAPITPLIVPDIEIGGTQILNGVMKGAIGADEFIQQNFSSPRLFQLDVKIMEIKLPAMQLVPTTPDGKNTVGTKTTIESFLKPQMTAALNAQASPAVMTGIVTGFTPQHLPLVSIQWPNGALSQNFILQFAAGNIDVGSELLLQPQILPATTTGNTAARPMLPLLPMSGLMEPSSLWSSVDEIYQYMMQSSPQSAQAMARVTPSPANGSQMGAAAMLFVAAVRAGDLSNWLGDKRIDAIMKSGKQSLLSALSNDGNAAKAANADASGPEWRSYPLPMMWQNEISKVLLHIKHEQNESNREDKEGSTRFILDLSLNRMGDVQLDGMIRGKRVDLVVRTQLPISHPMQQSMKIAYADALDGTDVFGEISFQGDLKQWMHVIKRDEHLGVSA